MGNCCCLRHDPLPEKYQAQLVGTWEKEGDWKKVGSKGKEIKEFYQLDIRVAGHLFYDDPEKTFTAPAFNWYKENEKEIYTFETSHACMMGKTISPGHSFRLEVLENDQIQLTLDDNPPIIMKKTDGLLVEQK